MTYFQTLIENWRSSYRWNFCLLLLLFTLILCTYKFVAQVQVSRHWILLKMANEWMEMGYYILKITIKAEALMSYSRNTEYIYYASNEISFSSYLVLAFTNFTETYSFPSIEWFNHYSSRVPYTYTTLHIHLHSL